MELTLYVKNFFKGHERSVKAKKQIFFSFFLKGISIVIGLLFVPLILNYLDEERYGIWLTLSSIIGWVAFFDFGLGNGLRNRFAEAVAKGDDHLARIYTSTTYGILGIIFAAILVAFFIVNPFLNWQKILNTTNINNAELTVVALIVFTFFILRFFFNLIGVILMADQRPAINSSFNPIGNILSITIIFILTKTTSGSLINLAAVLSIVPVLVLIFATVLFFMKDYRKYLPSVKFFDMSKSKDLIGLGFKFFYIQIAGMIFFSTTNFLIAQLVDQKSVVAYNIAFKYLFTINMLYGIIITPFWSAVTDAKARDDFDWIKRSLKNLNRISVLMSFVLILFLCISPFVYKFWIGDKVQIPFSLSLIITVYLIQQIALTPYSQFINGFGKLKLGLYFLTAKLIVFIPLSYYLSSKYNSFGIVLAMILIQIPSLIIEPMQVHKLINRKAKGIWNE